MFWECHETLACERFPVQRSGQLSANGFSLGFSAFYKRQVEIGMWGWIIETYSACELTEAGDKLIAISGVVKSIQQQTGDQYIAGLWRAGLEYQLCWERAHKDADWFSSKPASVRDPYKAPSWSWASIDTKIMRHHGEGSLLAKVLEAKTTPSD
jgi:hypothetical protein